MWHVSQQKLSIPKIFSFSLVRNVIRNVKFKNSDVRKKLLQLPSLMESFNDTICKRYYISQKIIRKLKGQFSCQKYK